MWWRPRTTITADRSSIVACRDAHVTHVTIEGSPPEELQSLADAVVSLTKLNGEQQAIIVDFAHQLGVSREQVLMFFRIIGETDVPLEQVGDRLVEIAERYKTLLVQGERKPNDDPVVARLKTKAHAAWEAGDFDRSDALLDEVENAVLDHAALEAAAVRAQRGDMALTRLRYLDAADHFAAAAARVPLGHEEDLADYGNRHAEALYRHGDEKADNARLRQAIDVLKALQERLGARMLPEWEEAIRKNLNIVRYMLGIRTDDKLLLEEAIKEFEFLADNPIDDRKPTLQTEVIIHLNNALFFLGDLENTPKQLEKAARITIDRFQPNLISALDADSRIAVDINSCNLLLRYGQRDSGPKGTEALLKAEEEYRYLLNLQHYKWEPRQRAAVRTHLGNSLLILGARDYGPKGIEWLKDAVNAFRQALMEQPAERLPLDRAQTESNLGLALLTLGKRVHDRAQLEEAREVGQLAFAAFMKAGQKQKHHRTHIEALLRAIDEELERLPPPS